MESLLVEQSFSPRKPIKNPKRNNNKPYNLHQDPRFYNNNNISRQASLSSQNYAPQVMMHEFDHMMMHHMHGGFFLNNHHAPYTNNNHHHGSKSLPPMSLGQHQQPPLLPLPAVSKPVFRSLPSHQPLGRTQSLSTPVPRKTTTKNNKTPYKKENKKNVITNLNNNNSVKFNSAKLSHESKVIGPDPETRGKDLTQMLLTDLDSWSVFNLAPPPSSLPLPKFYLRQIQKQHPLPPKLSCNAEVAAEVSQSGASDNLCKLLKLR